MLYVQDETLDAVYFIEAGFVKLVRLSADGDEAILGLRGDGWALGAACVSLNTAASCAAVAVTRCRVRCVPRRQFMNMLESDPARLRDVNRLLSMEAEAEQRRQIEFRHCGALGRLQRLLDELGRIGGGALSLRQLHLKMSEVAQLLGMSPEHLSRLRRRIAGRAHGGPHPPGA